MFISNPVALLSKHARIIFYNYTQRTLLGDELLTQAHIYSKKKVTYQAVFFLSNFISTNRIICITEQHELPQSGHKINNPKSKLEITRPSSINSFLKSVLTNVTETKGNWSIKLISLNTVCNHHGWPIQLHSAVSQMPPVSGWRPEGCSAILQWLLGGVVEVSVEGEVDDANDAWFHPIRVQWVINRVIELATA